MDTFKAPHKVRIREVHLVRALVASNFISIVTDRLLFSIRGPRAIASRLSFTQSSSEPQVSQTWGVLHLVHSVTAHAHKAWPVERQDLRLPSDRDCYGFHGAEPNPGCL